MQNFTDKVKRYATLNVSEIKTISLTIIFLSMIVAFNDHSDSFDILNWTMNFLAWFLIVAISMTVKILGHKLMGVFYGFRVEYKLWWYGLLIGIAIMLVTGGHVWILMPGGIMIYHIASHRLGWFRYGTNMRALSIISLSGPLAMIVFATFIKSIQIYTPLIPAQSLLVDRIYLFNLAFAAFSMLPIPPLDGSRVMYDSRLIYIFVSGWIIFYAILVSLDVYSWIYAFILAIALWFIYYHYFESKN